MSSGVYQIANTTDGKRYIGQAVDITRRWNFHRWSLRNNKCPCLKLQNAWNKHGEAAFRFSILGVCAPRHLTFFEQAWMDARKPEYNIAPAAGSNAGHTHTPEHNAKIAAALLGKKKPPRTAEHAEKIGAHKQGVPLTAKHRAAISLANTGRSKDLGTIPNMIAGQRQRRRADGSAVEIVFNGESRNASSWAAALGMRAKLIDQRIYRGWGAERALTTPVNVKHRRKS